MLILGIETSTKTGSVAIVSEEAVIAQYSLNIEITHSERLMSTVDRVLRDTGIVVSQLDGFSAAIGPGSFTGLRIGLSAVKGLALATGKPAVGVPTLQALAWIVPQAANPVCPLLDARKNEFYAALYSFDNMTLTQRIPESVLPLSGLKEWITGQTVFTGEAAHLYRSEIEQLFGERALFPPRSVTLPSAAAVAEIGLRLIREGGHTEPDEMVPRYIRRPEAEIAWEKKRMQPR